MEFYHQLELPQAAKAGKSILFILEPNPGPGVGVLLAYTFFGTGTAKRTAPGVAIIHAFGGIHEPYFPFILMETTDDNCINLWSRIRKLCI